MCTKLPVLIIVAVSFCRLAAKRFATTKDVIEGQDVQLAPGDDIGYHLPSKPAKRMQPGFSSGSLLTPPSSGFSGNFSQDKGASALLNASVLFEESQCDNPWTIFKYIAKGAQGTVYKVQKQIRGEWKRLALKVPNTPDDQEDIESEASIMSKSRSQGVMPLFESNPCLESSRGIKPPGMPRRFVEGGSFQIKGSYLTTLMEADFLHWINTASDNSKRRCEQMIIDQLHDAVRDLHSAGFIHGDLKADNILFESSPQQCPIGLRLTDFGLSGRIGEADMKYSDEYYSGSSHLPGCLFERTLCDLRGIEVQPRTCRQSCPYRHTYSKLNYAPFVCLCRGYERQQRGLWYLRDQSIDICALKILISDLFGWAPKFADLKGTGSGSCGAMGYGRRKVIDLP